MPAAVHEALGDVYEDMQTADALRVAELKGEAPALDASHAVLAFIQAVRDAQNRLMRRYRNQTRMSAFQEAFEMIVSAYQSREGSVPLDASSTPEFLYDYEDGRPIAKNPAFPTPKDPQP